MERAGLVRRTRDPANRRVQRMELTEEGDAAFHRMREAAVAFDKRLRSGLDEANIERAREVLAGYRPTSPTTNWRGQTP